MGVISASLGLFLNTHYSPLITLMHTAKFIPLSTDKHHNFFKNSRIYKNLSSDCCDVNDLVDLLLQKD